jgi:hypothetical protein
LVDAVAIGGAPMILGGVRAARDWFKSRSVKVAKRVYEGAGDD